MSSTPCKLGSLKSMRASRSWTKTEERSSIDTAAAEANVEQLVISGTFALVLLLSRDKGTGSNCGLERIARLYDALNT